MESIISDKVFSKMAVKTDVNLTAFYTELNKFGNNGDYNRAIKVAKKSK